MKVAMAVDIKSNEISGFEKEWNINGEKVTLSVEK
jgi:isoleucyl-tRNA synthetase